MTRSCFLLAGLAMAFAPTARAQVGLSSASQTIALSAVKQGVVGIALADSARAGVPAFAVTWNVDPERTGSVAVAASTGTTGPGPDVARFTQPISADNARGRRDRIEMSTDSTGTLTVRVTTQ